MKKIAFLLIMCVLILSLAGCVQLPFTSFEEEEVVQMPDVAPTQYIVPTSDSEAERTSRVTLYYLSQGQQLTSIIRTVSVKKGESIAEAAVKRLLEAPEAVGLTAIVPEGTQLISFENNGNGIVTVNLSGDPLIMSAQELVWMRAAIVMTLTELEDIQYVNVLINGREESPLTLPMGSMQRPETGITALWGQLQGDEDLARQDGNTAAIERTVTLYFPSKTSKMLLAETRVIHFTSENIAERVIAELVEGPDSPYSHTSLPVGASFLAEEGASIENTESGQKLIRIHVREDIIQALSEQKMDFDTMCNSLAYTLCRFVPEIDGIELYANGELLTDVILTDSLSAYAGRCADLYFTNESGTLSRCARIFDQNGAMSARTLLTALIEGPGILDANMSAVFPDGITEADLAAVAIDNGTAYLHFTAHFYSCCQSMTQQEERNMLYAIVNTLTELDDVSIVYFAVDGEPADSIAGHLYLRGGLMRNPGIIAE